MLRRRLADGRVGYVYLMHDERRAIEYPPVDLEMIGRTPDWERLDAREAPAPDAALAGYDLVDYADIGDMEGDPQADAWIRKSGAAPGQADPGHRH